MDDIEYFFANIDKSKDCWEWLGFLNTYGYGRFYRNKKRILAHRYSWEIHNGNIPKGSCVLHKCDNRKCVNPAHLFLGTKHDNTVDMVKKNRQATGTRHWNAKLNEQDVRDIRKLFSTQLYSYTELGRVFNVCYQQIIRIVSYKSWKCVQ